MNTASLFNAAARQYGDQLDQGLALSGESAEYFVEGRLLFLANYLERRLPQRDLRVLDFGCGVGNACGRLRTHLGARHVIGLDCSSDSLEIAAQRHSGPAYSWTIDGDDIPPRSLDVAYTSGVFHHIPPADRQAALVRIYGWLRPGGYLALFENNPWNLGTRWVMSRIPFDADAQCLSIRESRRRLVTAGFEVQHTRSLFYFPGWLSGLRPLENRLGGLPLGAQYVIIARRPRRLNSGR